MGRHSLPPRRRHAAPSDPDLVDPKDTIPITAQDGYAHQCTVQAHVEGRPAGMYMALCGKRVAGAAMVAPHGKTCYPCVARLIPQQRQGR